MARPPLEVADLIRAAGTTFYERSRKWFTWLHLKILTAIVCCRTATLGGHIDECSRCGHRKRSGLKFRAPSGCIGRSVSDTALGLQGPHPVRPASAVSEWRVTTRPVRRRKCFV